MCDNMIIDWFHGPKTVASKGTVHYFICSRKMMVHLTVLRWVFLGSAVISLREWVCDCCVCKLLVPLLGSWPVRERSVLAELGACPAGLEPTNCCSHSASAVVLLYRLLSAMQAFIVQTRPHLFWVPWPSKPRVERNAEHFLSPSFLQTHQFIGFFKTYFGKYFHFPYPPLAVELHCWWFEQISVAENVTGWSPVSDHRKSLLKNLFWSLTVDQENNDFRGVFLHQHFKPEIWVFRTVCAGTPTPSTSGPPVLPRGRHEVRKVVTWVTGHHQEYLDFLESLLLDVKFWERAPRLVIWKMVMFIAEKRIVFPGWM